MPRWRMHRRGSPSSSPEGLPLQAPPRSSPLPLQPSQPLLQPARSHKEDRRLSSAKRDPAACRSQQPHPPKSLRCSMQAHPRQMQPRRKPVLRTRALPKPVLRMRALRKQLPPKPELHKPVLRMRAPRKQLPPKPVLHKPVSRMRALRKQLPPKPELRKPVLRMQALRQPPQVRSPQSSRLRSPLRVLPLQTHPLQALPPRTLREAVPPLRELRQPELPEQALPLP